MKQALKGLLRKAAGKASLRSKRDPAAAERLLQSWSPAPEGNCRARHRVELQYDLQIVIPVYNGEKYIGQCLDSVLGQKTRYRVLATVVNDGSTDGTERILAVLPKDGAVKVQVLSQENRGLSAARNSALEPIRGQYVTFLDGDDVLAEGAVEVMLDAAFSMNAEILQGSWYTFSKTGREPHVLPKEGLLEDNRGVFSGYPWGKLFKYTVLEGFRFPEGYWFEDTPLSFLLAAMGYRFGAIRDVVYGYRENPEGITATSVHARKAVDSYWITAECLKELPDFGLSYDRRAYEYLLGQSVMNGARAGKQPWRIRRAQFLLTCGLVERYFPRMKSEKPELKEIEGALRNREFIKFELLLRGM